MKFTRGWYRVRAYGMAHFFPSRDKSFCGILIDETDKLGARKGFSLCPTCQHWTGDK